MGNCWSRFRIMCSCLPIFGDHESTPSSPSTMGPSQPSPVDSVQPSPPMDAVHEEIDPVEQTKPSKERKSSESEIEIDSVEHINPSKGFKFSESNPANIASTSSSPLTMEPLQPSPLDSVPPSRMEYIREKYENIESVEQIDLLISFVQIQQQTMNTPSSNTSEGLESICKELLSKILEMANDVKRYLKQMPGEVKKLCSEDRIALEDAFRSWSSTIAAAPLQNTNKQLRDVKGSLAVASLHQHWDKDVFLSHSGKQKDFVRKLHKDLNRKNVSNFFDQDRSSLPLGENFPRLIFKAAKACKMAVVVLSKDFIRSKWPMLELSAFVKANVPILPVFYKINTEELKAIPIDTPEWQKLEVRAEWKNALEVVRSYNGLPFGEDGDEENLRAEVVQAICEGINHRRQLLDFQPVGIEEHVREVKAKLNMEGPESGLAVIVCGFGGIGKTTVAASFVQSLDRSTRNYFKICWVTIDEKSPDRTSHIIKLQKDIIRDLERVEPDLRDLADGRVKIKEAFKKKCSLLVIDNVVETGYVKDLLPKDLLSDEPNTKLRIIVTSREKNVKAELDIKWEECKVEGLSVEASKSLLSKTILGSLVVNDKDEESMINEVATACRGVPLLLSVFGNHLRVQRGEGSYQKKSYEEALEALKNGNLDGYRKEEKIGKTLLFVYHKIEENVKEAFLDICKYFHGWKWNIVEDIVDWSTLQDLERRMLVSSSPSAKVIVHDILRLMVMNESNLTRFSDYETLSNALNGALDGFEIEKVKGISLLNDKFLIPIQSTKLEAMRKSLRVLMLGDWVSLEGPPCQGAFPNLRYLHVGDIVAFPFEDPTKLDKLRVVMNRSKPGMIVMKPVSKQLPSSLKRIYHEAPLGLSDMEEFIQDIGRFIGIESVIVHRSVLKCLLQGFGKLTLSMKADFISSSEHCGGFMTALSKGLGGLQSLQTLELSECHNLKMLPVSFGELRVQSLNLRLANLETLPNSFGKMPLVKNLSLESCNSLKSLPQSFVQLEMLETLKIKTCRKLSFLPHGFGKLQKLRFLFLEWCSELKTLSDDFENMSSLEGLWIKYCKELDGAMMEKILKLKNCYMADISGSINLKKKWKEMQGETEHAIVVQSSAMRDSKEIERALKIALLHGKCVEVENGSGQLMERSSLLEKGTPATLALIMLPIYVQSDEHQTLQAFVEKARKRAESNVSAKLQIVCAIKVDLYAETPSPTEEEERAEEEYIRKILQWLPKGSCAIPSSEWKRGKILTLCCKDRHDEFSFSMANVGVDMKFTTADKISEYLPPPPEIISKQESKHYDTIPYCTIEYNPPDGYNSIQKFITSICERSQSQCVAGENKTREFIEVLMRNRINHLLTENGTNELMVDHLHGKTIGLIICNVQDFERGKLQQIFKDVRQESNFLAIWIREGWSHICGHGTHTRATEYWPWATFPHGVDIISDLSPSFVFLDERGHIAIQNVKLAWDLLVGWGGKLYPFTQQTIRESFFLMESESCLEFLLHGMNIVGRKPMKSKMTFLYAVNPSEREEKREFTGKLEKLRRIHGNFEVLYVGQMSSTYYYKIDEFKQDYEDTMQDMRWPSLSFSETIMFWHRCKFLASAEGYKLYKDSKKMMETVHGLAKHLVKYKILFVLCDKSGVVTLNGKNVVEMICDESGDGEGNGTVKTRVKDELMKSLSTGECTPIVKTFFRDEIHNHPLHPQHRILHSTQLGSGKCDVCESNGLSWTRHRCECDECDWEMCGTCWKTYAKEQTEQLIHAKDN